MMTGLWCVIYPRSTNVRDNSIAFSKESYLRVTIPECILHIVLDILQAGFSLSAKEFICLVVINGVWENCNYLSVLRWEREENRTYGYGPGERMPGIIRRINPRGVVRLGFAVLQIDSGRISNGCSFAWEVNFCCEFLRRQLVSFPGILIANTMT